jgi:uncharacterized protein (TIGR00661 family)
VVFRQKGPNFLEDLAACRAIIGTTGFSLIEDSIYLKKPYFGAPLRKQFEQTNNARFLRERGFGDFSEHITREEIVRFLANLALFRENLRRKDLDPAEQEETLLRILGSIDASGPRPRAAL